MPPFTDPVQDDRYIVLLKCGHWTQTRVPDAGRWPCPDEDAVVSEAAPTTAGGRAVLASWDLAIEAQP